MRQTVQSWFTNYEATGIETLTAWLVVLILLFIVWDWFDERQQRRRNASSPVVPPAARNAPLELAERYARRASESLPAPVRRGTLDPVNRSERPARVVRLRRPTEGSSLRPVNHAPERITPSSGGDAA